MIKGKPGFIAEVIGPTAAAMREETGTVINGCSVVSFSRMSTRCRKCDYRDYCESKRRESVAAILPDFRPTQKTDDITNVLNSMGRLGVSADDVSEAISRAMNCMAEKGENSHGRIL